MNSKYLFLSTLLLPTGLYAANSDNTLAMLGNESMYFDDMPVVISPTRLAQPLNESPVSTTVIDRQMIDASGAQNIPDILRLVPGFTVGYLNGNSPVAAYHGQSGRLSKRIQLVIDGRSVYLPTQAGVSWSDLIINIEDIERLEIVRGPNASTYGNNAFLAVVSITTKHASENLGHYIKGTAGSHDTADGFYRFTGQTDNLDYRVSVGTKNNSGTDLLKDFTETDTLSYRLDYQLDLTTQMYYSGGFQDSQYGDVIESASDTNNDVEVSTAFQHIRLEHTFDSGNSLNLQYYYNYTKSYESGIPQTIDGSPLGIDSFDITDTIDLTSERHDLELSYYYQPLEALRLVSGTSVRLDKVGANNVFDKGTDSSLLLYRAFTHGEYSFNKNWQLNAGVMVENNEISATDVSPRLTLIHHLGDNHSFRLGASKATRTPTIYDEYGYVALEQTLTRNAGQPLAANDPLRAILGGDQIIDVNVFSPGGVNAEEITSYEFGWMMNFINNKLIIDIKLYKDEISNLITAVDQLQDVPNENTDDLNAALGIPYIPGTPGYNANAVLGNPGAEYAGNTTQTNTQGLEIYSDYQITTDWRVYAFFAYTEISALTTNNNLSEKDKRTTTGRLEVSAPKKSYGAMLMKSWGDNLNTSLSLYHVSDMDWLDRTSSRNALAIDYRDRSAEAYTRVDFVIRKTQNTRNGKIRYSFILQNLAGEYSDYTRSNYTDASMQTINVPGSIQDPRGYFELAFSFN